MLLVVSLSTVNVTGFVGITERSLRLFRKEAWIRCDLSKLLDLWGPCFVCLDVVASLHR
jgi:hypothetical protein